MKIVPEDDGNDVESGLRNLVRMAEISRDLMIALGEHYQWDQVPKEFGDDFECAIFAAMQLRDMAGALKVEYYAELERQRVKPNAA